MGRIFISIVIISLSLECGRAERHLFRCRPFLLGLLSVPDFQKDQATDDKCHEADPDNDLCVHLYSFLRAANHAFVLRFFVSSTIPVPETAKSSK